MSSEGIKGYLLDDWGNVVIGGASVIDEDFNQTIGPDGEYFRLTTSELIDNKPIYIKVSILMCYSCYLYINIYIYIYIYIQKQGTR